MTKIKEQNEDENILEPSVRGKEAYSSKCLQ